MLKEMTQIELERLSSLMIKNMEYLIKHCGGILNNELKAQYINGFDSQYQRNIKMQLELLESGVVANLNHAIDHQNTENFRFELIKFYNVIEALFSSCLAARDEKDIPEQRDNGQVKGHYLNVLQEIVDQCQKAKVAINQDRQIKSEQVKINKFADQISNLIRAVGQLCGKKTEKTKDQRICHLIVSKAAMAHGGSEKSLPKKRH